ncbi:T9SS type B sorting domain-containing protein [Flavobacterium sp. GSB-24]|uniref:T9SS type B sorting domain-containing protein n=1 Tax=Flavobacterium sp. GSB-24 TaxID=2994319 RepID=UPI00248FD063|nr:T9SS type B sorting domain-containing protein [Flavobacterium sp. GSB-24]BDU25487.1 hypothetical protein FLGSB24_22310 [Flavobacterium sp. GSB-24]
MSVKKITSFLLFFIVLSASSQQWKQNFKIVEPIRIRDNSFGFSVSTFDGYAAYSADEVDIAGVENAGKIYIAKQDCDGWSIYQELTLPDAINYCGFGTLIVMEGKTLAIVGCDPVLGLGGKAVYMYERDSDDLYKLKQKITRSENIIYDNYGTTLAMSGDFMVVGAFYNSTDGNFANYLENAGAAYIYHRNNTGTWDFVQKIVASDRERRDNFGNSVSIFENTIVVGAVEEGVNWAGAAYVFEKNSNSNTWREVQKLTAYDFRGLQDRFAATVKVAKDDIVISAPGEDDYDSSESGDGGGPLTFAGSIYVFRKNASNQWTGFQKIRASDVSVTAGLGGKIEISNDKMAVVGGERVYDNLGALSKVYGRVYMFQKDKSNNKWVEYQIVHPIIKNNSDSFGSSISLYNDDFFVGAYWAALDANEQNYVGYAGAVYIFNTYEYLNSSKPVLNTIPILTSCADLGNGFSSSFDMSTIEKDLVANPENYVFTYTDKNGNKLPSPLPNNYSNINPFSENINIRVANKNNPSCYEDTKIELETISSFTLNIVPDLYNCDLNGTGFATFDLSKVNSVLVNDPSLFTFSYFDKNGNDISSLINESYINSTKNFQEIVVNVTEISTNCSAKSKINLYVSNAGSDCKKEEETYSYIIPQFFTPNADGFNDTWEIKGLENQNYSVHIFDRYGKLLKTLGKNGSWDGNYNGNALPSSDYWFQLVLENGIIKKGHFSLKR